MPSGFTTLGGHDPHLYDLKTVPSNAIVNCVHASAGFHTDEDCFTIGSPSLTHWVWMTQICVSKLGRHWCRYRRVDISAPSHYLNRCWHNLDWTLWTNFRELKMKIERFPYKKMHFKMSSAKCQPFCLGLNMLITFVHPQNSILMKIASPRTCWLQPVTCWIVYENMAKQFMFLPFREAELAQVLKILPRGRRYSIFLT